MPGAALLRGEQCYYVDEYDNTANHIHSEALLTQHVHVITHYEYGPVCGKSTHSAAFRDEKECKCEVERTTHENEIVEPSTQRNKCNTICELGIALELHRLPIALLNTAKI